MKIKFFTAAIILALASASLTACGDTDNTASGSTSSDSVSAENGGEDDAESLPSEEGVIASADAYSVYLDYFEENIGYAQISGMSDTAVQEKVNEQLKSTEYSRYERSQNYESYAEVNYCDDSVLSLTQIAVFDGGSLETGGYSLTHMNFNMETGEELELSDIADVNAMAEKFFNRDGVTVVDSYEGADIEQFFSEGYIESAADLCEYISGSSFTLDENKNIILRFPTEDGVINAYVES